MSHRSQFLLYFIPLLLLFNLANAQKSIQEIVDFNAKTLEEANTYLKEDTNLSKQLIKQLIIDYPEFPDTTFRKQLSNKIDFYWNNFSSSSLFDQIKMARKICSKRKDSIAKAYLDGIVSEAFLSNYQLDSSLYYIQEAFDYYSAKQALDKMGELLLRRGTIYYTQGKYLESIEDVFQAAKYFEKSNESKNLAFSYLQLGSTYLYVKFFNRAKTNYFKAARQFLKLGDTLGYNVCLSNIGLVHLEKEEYDSSIYYLNVSLDQLIESKRLLLIGTSYRYLGYSYQGLGDFDSSFRYYQKALDTDLQYNYPIGISSDYIGMAELFQLQGKVDSALYYAELAYSNFKGNTDHELESDISKVLAALYKIKNRSEESNKFYIQYCKIQDTIRQEAKVLAKIVEVELERLENIEYELLTVKEQEVALKKEKENQKYIIISLTVLASIVLVLLAIVSATSRRNKVLNETLNKQKEQIKKELEIKESLLAEIHHRVKNNLQLVSSMINLQSQYISDTKAKKLLSECRNRIVSMSLIHEGLYPSKNQRSFDVYLMELIQKLKDAYESNENNIEIETKIEDIALSIDESVPIGLIIHEVVTNALKHAFPNNYNGVIKISLKKIGQNFELIISDNGVGLTKGINQESFGLMLIKTMAAQMEATLVSNYQDGVSHQIVWRTNNSTQPS